jgi:hypothetical protein
MEWAFRQRDHVICQATNCMGETFTGVPRTFSSPALGDEFFGPCGTIAKYPLFRIGAKIDVNTYVKDKVSDFTISMWDAPTCVKDGKAAKAQLTTAAIKFYKEKH